MRFLAVVSLSIQQDPRCQHVRRRSRVVMAGLIRNAVARMQARSRRVRSSLMVGWRNVPIANIIISRANRRSLTCFGHVQTILVSCATQRAILHGMPVLVAESITPDRRRTARPIRTRLVWLDASRAHRSESRSSLLRSRTDRFVRAQNSRYR